MAIQADCGLEMDIRRVIRIVEFKLGPIACFVSNAGIPANGGLDVPDMEWYRLSRKFTAFSYLIWAHYTHLLSCNNTTGRE